ncbi:MAG: hypothetical protein AUH30_03300 [Candidatus Rokubacteria bacterium 13_1_40CM_68_15]|nr:MAG: hypothetical protein AUH30_03300 [Candidatus Rokubacteria bacterium 13_1_40CM_68_15]
MQRSHAILFLVLGLVVLGLVGEIVPLYTDWLWFQEVGYTEVFLTTLKLRGSLFTAVAVVVLTFLYGNLTFAARRARPDVLWELEDQLGLPGRVVIEPIIRRFLPIVLAFIAFASGLRASARWETLLQYLSAVPFGTTDPLFGRDLGFFVFTLPFWRMVVGWATVLVIGTLVLTVVIYVLQRSLVLTARGPRLAAGARSHLLLLGCVFLSLAAIGFWLDRFELLYSPRGVVFGASYTDIHASLPVLNALTVLSALCAVACLVQITRGGLRLIAAGLLVLVGVWILGLGIYPALLQRFRVTPNELAAERPFIQHNIRMTRQAYGLDRVEEKEFPADESLDARALERNAPTIKNIRLWDHRPLLRTFAQLQEIRTYYRFVDVDNDRYTVNGEYRQLMLSARELSYQNLQTRAGSWINEHLTFTHGYGVIVGPVNRITPEGLPELWVKDIPPRSEGFTKITRPEVYFGEISNDYVLVRTRSQELDYPAGDQNVYATYAGRGGIQLVSWLRKLLFAARFGEIKLLLSNDLTPESRLMMYRTVGERVRAIAPFFQYDRDPYIVVTDDGRLVWMLDGYTTTDRYPYSDPVRGLGNYIRNSVKVVVDAYHGTVSFYVADATDPIVRVYGRAFPGLLRPLAEMPADLQRHIRYPEDFFTIQARKYATYHMLDPQVFYNKEDLWAIPRRTVEGRDREMEPYYTIMRLPAEAREEFILLTLFNPARRDNMIAWLAARTDPGHYGRLIAYNFPKQKLVYGPRQIDARIDQDPVISQQLSLWNQRGSTVIRGSLLAIPIDQSLIYVQPLYLAASEQGALPELRRVIVAYGNQIAMEPTLEQSLARIFGGRPAATGVSAPTPPSGAPRDVASSARALAQRAWEIWERSQDALRRGDWSLYGAEQKRLEETLRTLRESSR